jgi:hypothetical protein
MILHCTCKQDYQDRVYGNGNRVHNVSKDGKKAKCVICGKEKVVKKEEKL